MDHSKLTLCMVHGMCIFCDECTWPLAGKIKMLNDHIINVGQNA